MILHEKVKKHIKNGAGAEIVGYLALPGGDASTGQQLVLGALNC
jgi:hypothetical protein